MLSLFNIDADAVKHSLQKFQYVIIAVLFTLALVLPMMMPSTAGAAALEQRSVTISSSVGDATGVSYDFSFDLPSTTPAQGILLEFCTTALGTCTLPTSMDVQTSTDVGTETWSESDDPWEVYGGADTNDCTYGADAYQLCLERTDTDSETAVTKTIEITGVENPTLAGNFTNVFVRITIYSDTAFATAVHDGTVVAAIVRQITVNGRVSERLDFCVGAVLDDNGGTGGEDTEIEAIGNNTVCADLPGDTVVDIGTLDDSAVTVSPVPVSAISGSNGNYGVAAVKTNALNGVSVAFYADDAASVSGGDTDHLKAFRVAPTDCDADQTTGAGLVDQCFRSAASTGEDFTALSGATQERFGMQVSCFEQNDGTRSTTAALTADADFADSNTAAGIDCEDADDATNFAWNETATATDLASSTTVVDDELIKFNFGAIASSTTPTGLYTVVSTYIATATF
ncbi:MAG TPA: hypothetical protein VFX79_02065 [Candidatus Saccharimonadales bacterium]|nr:hypothetical protein [Candidatus Saccharimonadales bacterium]